MSDTDSLSSLYSTCAAPELELWAAAARAQEEARAAALRQPFGVWQPAGQLGVVPLSRPGKRDAEEATDTAKRQDRRSIWERTA